MANEIINCCEAEVRLSKGLVQFVLPSKFIKSIMSPKMSVKIIMFADDLQMISASLHHTSNISDVSLMSTHNSKHGSNVETQLYSPAKAGQSAIKISRYKLKTLDYAPSLL